MFSLLTLLDDIATTFDDVAVMTKVAIKKTSALMSDDLAVNTAVVHGVNPNREIPIVTAIFIGSLWNKLYCLLGLFAILAIYPPVLSIILLLGGLYLSYEGAHKLVEKLTLKGKSKPEKRSETKVVSESQRIKGAVRTDLILSAEILVIAKNALSGNLLTQGVTLVVIGLAASVVIYGLVALLVKVDDFGLYLVEKDYRRVGSFLVSLMPYLMKGLGVLGTVAMFMVGGGIIAHTFHIPKQLPEFVQNMILGLVAGLLIVFVAYLIKLALKNKEKNY